MTLVIAWELQGRRPTSALALSLDCLGYYQLYFDAKAVDLTYVPDPALPQTVDISGSWSLAAATARLRAEGYTVLELHHYPAEAGRACTHRYSLAPL